MNIDDYSSISKKALKLVGLYPVSLARYWTCTICMSAIIIPQSAQLYSQYQDIDAFLETCSVLFTIMLAVTKSIIWISNKGRMVLFIDFLYTDYWQSVNNHPSSHLQRYALLAKRITQWYSIIILITLVCFYCLPIVEVFINIATGNDNYTMQFPFIANYPDFYYYSPVYELVYTTQIVATSFCAVMAISMDSMIVSALCHTCAHYKILQTDIRDLDNSICNVDSLNWSSKNTKRLLGNIKMKIRDIIKHHQTVLWFCDNMEANVNPLLLVQMAASTLIICLVILEVSTTLAERYKLIKYISYLLVALSELLMFCFCGNELITESFLVGEAAYSIKWYNLPAHMSTEIAMLIMRSQKPSIITAGKFYVMHLANFSSALSSSLSYFMVLRSMNAEQ